MSGGGEAPEKEIRLPGGLNIWQGATMTAGGMLLTAVIGVNVLTERMEADRRQLSDVRAQVSAMVLQINQMSVELARQGERLAQMQQRAEMRLQVPRN